VFGGGRGIVAVNDDGVTGLDPQGTVTWEVGLPDAVGNAVPDRLTADDHTAYVTFRPRSERDGPLDADVAAIALDAEG
jgi:hypothetical protein